MTAIVDVKDGSEHKVTWADLKKEMRLHTGTVVMCLFLTFGGFAHGYDNGVIGGTQVMSPFRVAMGWPEDASVTNSKTTSEAQWITGAFCIGACISGFFGGQLTDVFGRKKVFCVGGILFATGGAIQSFGSSYLTMILGRAVAGVAIGALSCVAPMYSCELATPMMRGMLTSFYQINVDVAIVISSILTYAMRNVYVGWRVALGVQVVLGVIMCFGVLFVPESPKWLLRKGRKEECMASLQRLRGCDDHIAEEYRMLEKEVEKEQMDGAGAEYTWREVFSTSKVYNTFIIGGLLQFFQIVTGINAIIFFSPSMFGVIGISPFIGGLAGNITFLVGTIIEVLIVDLVGRRKLLVGGMFMQAVSILAAGVVCAVYNNDLTGHTGAGAFVVICICLFLGFFGLGYGPGAWVYCSEMFSPQARGKGIGFTTAVNWGTNILTAFGTPPMFASASYGTSGAFFTFGALCLVCLPFTYLMIPEIKGVPLEGMSHLFDVDAIGGWKAFTRANRKGVVPDAARVGMYPEKSVDKESQPVSR